MTAVMRARSVLAVQDLERSARHYLDVLGFTEDDWGNGGSDRLVDAIVAWGTPEQIANVPDSATGEYLARVLSPRLKPVRPAGNMATLVEVAARNQLLGMASQSKVVSGLRPDGLEDAPQLQLDIDRERAAAMGVGFDAIGNVLSTALGSAYINDFPNRSRMQRVVVQADAPARMQPEQILALNVTNTQGQSVPLSAFVTTRWVTGQMQAVRYNGYPAMRISGANLPVPCVPPPLSGTTPCAKLVILLPVTT